MLFKTTTNELRTAYANGEKMLAIGYCGAQYLLGYQNRIAYTKGTYGWNCDIYQINSGFCSAYIITTGYRQLVGKRANYELLNEYEKQARRIAGSGDIPYSEKPEKINALLLEYLAKEFATEGDDND